MIDKIRSLPKSFPWALLGVCVLAFGLMIPWLGFYQDDWYQIWFGRAFGTHIYIDYYAWERPGIAWLYLLTTPLLGTTPLAWQIFGLLARWLAGISVWWFLRLVWPRSPQQTAWAALLFVLYPGFRIQSASVIYSHYFLQLAIQIGSLGLMLVAYRRRRWLWPLTILAVLGAAFGLFSSEYFFGIELARPVFLWLESGKQKQTLANRFRQVMLRWSPYLAVLAGFLIWRILIFQFPTFQPFYVQHPGAGFSGWASGLAATILRDIPEMGLLAWAKPVQVLAQAASLRLVALAGALLAGLSGLILFLYLRFVRLPETQSRSAGVASGTFSYSAILTGVFLLWAAGWPFWFVDLNVNLEINGGSRFGISFMLGSALLLAGLIDWLGRRPTLKIALVGLLAGLAIGFHFVDADFFREVNRTQASFFQQLAWRAPGLKPGTLILTNSFEDHVMSGDNSLTAALNWIYEPQPPYSLDYILFYIPTRLETGDLTSLEPGQPFYRRFRTAEIYSSTDHALVVYYPYPHCLRVLDPRVDQDLPRPVDMPRELKAAIPISNLNQIIPEADPPASLPPALFKAAGDPDPWCYYVEKADLARQQGQWDNLATLADQALAGERKIRTTWEVLPFIEGYARSGQIAQARALALEVNRLHPDGRAMTNELLCRLVDRLETQAGSDPDLAERLGELQTELACP